MIVGGSSHDTARYKDKVLNVVRIKGSRCVMNIGEEACASIGRRKCRRSGRRRRRRRRRRRIQVLCAANHFSKMCTNTTESPYHVEKSRLRKTPGEHVSQTIHFTGWSRVTVISSGRQVSQHHKRVPACFAKLWQILLPRTLVLAFPVL